MSTAEKTTEQGAQADEMALKGGYRVFPFF